jgi:uncharacterized membrane protein YgcG
MRKRRLRRTAFLAFFLCLVFLAALGTALAASSQAPASPPHRGLTPLSNNLRSAIAVGDTWRQDSSTEKSWEFERFDSDININDNGSFDVRETQVVNFTGSFTFITRDLSTQMAKDVTEGRTYGKVRIKDVEVYDLDGTPYDSDLWEVDSYQGGKKVRIEFQAQDEQRGWIISYRMCGAIIYAEDYDRLYWNAVSYYRDVPINSSRITVTLPPGTDMAEVEATDYYQPVMTDSYYASGRDGDVLWWEAEDIWPYRDFTIDVAVPKGVIDKPYPYRSSTFWLVFALAFAILLGTLAFMLVFWWFKGRDASADPVMGVSYEAPRELRPAVMGMLVNQQPRIDDISATVVDLAVRGKLRIIEEPEEVHPGVTEFSFERKDTSTRDLLPYEAKLMKAMFGKKTRVEESDLDLFGDAMQIMNGVRKEVKKRKLFHNEPEKTAGRYFRWGIAVTILPPVVMFILHFFLDLGWFWFLLVGLVPAGIIIAVIGRAMPKRTPEGSRLFWQAMGFREYLKTAEAGEPESMTPQNFQDNLPYAIVLGMAEKWAQLFADIYTTAPDWYSGTGPGFSTTRLASSLKEMGWGLYGTSGSSSSGSGGSFSSSSSGGFGGGSSGGGFGGGGSSAG